MLHLPNASFMQIYATEDGKTKPLWEKIVGQVSILSPENYGRIDWLMYVCSFFQCILQQYAIIIVADARVQPTYI